jgi:hypothetical protein
VTRPRCSVVAQAAGDPLEGTAPPAGRWFLVEHPRPWGRVAFTESNLHPHAVSALAGWADAVNARIVLIRRPGRRARAQLTRRWFRVDSRPGHESIRTGEYSDGSDLAAAIREPGESFAGPLHLVCVHGRHDVCCAVRGYPLVKALAAVDPRRTWECSHIGGCRFAPVLVLLPHGYTFGGVPAAHAAELVGDYAGGRVDPRWARGRSSLPPAAQAAQHHARQATGATGVDALRVVSVRRDGAAGWRVTLGEPDCTVLLRERRVDAGRPLTCLSHAPGRMRVFDLVELRR